MNRGVPLSYTAMRLTSLSSMQVHMRKINNKERPHSKLKQRRAPCRAALA